MTDQNTGIDLAPYPIAPARAWLTLVLLGLLYLMSFVDRFVLALLVEPLKRDLGVSDIQLGLLFGTAFAFFYALLGLPLARLADRHNRRLIIICGAALWAICTICSGLVTNYGWLVALRIGLAVGEAALTPSVFSMIGDMFPARDRRRAASIYSAFGMLGAGGGYIMGGLVISWLGSSFDPANSDFRLWQLVFISVGVPSLVLTVIFALVVREPARQGRPEDESSMAHLLAHFAREKGLFSSLILGAGLCQIPAYAMIAWMPNTLERGFGLSSASSGLAFGSLAILATVGGTLTLPWLTDRLVGRWQAAAPARVSGLAALSAAAAMLLAGTVSGLLPFLFVVGFSLMMLAGSTNNILAAFQHLVPAQMRATFAALCLLSITLLGLGIGPPAFAAINSLIGPAGQGAATIALLTIGATVPAVLFFGYASRRLRVRNPLADA